MKVFDWKGNKSPKDNQVHEVHMYIGIGMMNNELLLLIDEMSDFLRLQSRSINNDKVRLEMSNVFDNATFEKTTFGKQVHTFTNMYKNSDFGYDRLFEIVSRRNHYIHHVKVNEINNFNELSRDLYRLIHTIINARNAIKQNKDKLKSDLNKTKVKSKQTNPYDSGSIRQKLNQIISECSDSDGWANMASVANQLSKKNIDYKKLSCKYSHLKSILEELGYKIEYDGTVPYVHKK